MNARISPLRVAYHRRRVATIPIETPLKYIPVHIIKPPGIRLLLPDGMGVFTRIVFKPSDGYAAIVKWVFDAVTDLGLNACPPLVVGVGLGHNVENAAVLSKKAYLRPLGTHHPHPKGAKLEEDLFHALNKVGIGAQGLKGNRVAMAVNVESSAHHTATIAVGVNVSCYTHRRGYITFDQNLDYTLDSYKGVTL